MTITTDMERLLARDDPGLRQALTSECPMMPTYRKAARRIASQTSVVDLAAELHDVNGKHCAGCHGLKRVPLPDAEAHVALERWVHDQPDGVVWSDAAGYSVSWAQADKTGGATGPRIYNGQGATLAGAVNAALEAK